MTGVGRYDELAGVAQQAIRMVGRHTGRGSLPGRDPPLVPVTEYAWLLVGQLAQQNFLAAGQLTAATSRATDMHTVIKARADTDPSNTQWQRDLSIYHNKLRTQAVRAEEAD